MLKQEMTRDAKNDQRCDFMKEKRKAIREELTKSRLLKRNASDQEKKSETKKKRKFYDRK